MIADDANIVRSTLQEVLGDAGYHLVIAEDGNQAIQRLSEEVDVALLDLDMPGPGVLDCLRHITAHWPAIETVVVTGSTEITHAVEAMKNGAFDYVTKPVNFDELLEVVSRAVGQVRIKSENRQLREAMSVPPMKVRFIGESQPAREVLSRVKKVAGLDSTVLIRVTIYLTYQANPVILVSS